MTTSSNYHHGDLRTALINTATSIIEERGIDALSLRKLAEQVGVSRTAPYHHFKDKNALLSAIAAKGFDDWHSSAKAIFEQQDKAPGNRRGEIVAMHPSEKVAVDDIV